MYDAATELYNKRFEKKKIMMNMKIYCMVKKWVPSQAQEYIPKGLNALTPKKLLSRLPLLLVQVKTVNNL